MKIKIKLKGPTKKKSGKKKGAHKAKNNTMKENTKNIVDTVAVIKTEPLDDYEDQTEANLPDNDSGNDTKPNVEKLPPPSVISTSVPPGGEKSSSPGSACSVAEDKSNKYTLIRSLLTTCKKTPNGKNVKPVPYSKISNFRTKQIRLNNNLRMRALLKKHILSKHHIVDEESEGEESGSDLEIFSGKKSNVSVVKPEGGSVRVLQPNAEVESQHDTMERSSTDEDGQSVPKSGVKTMLLRKILPKPTESMPREQEQSELAVTSSNDNGKTPNTEELSKTQGKAGGKSPSKKVPVRKLLPPNKSYDESHYVMVKEVATSVGATAAGTRTSPRKSPKKPGLLDIMSFRKSSPVKVMPEELNIKMPPVQVGLIPPPAKKRKEGVECQECGHVAPNNGDLKKHMRKHSTDKPYACPVAGCSFRTKHPGNIRHHMPRHQDDRPHSCNLCELKFKTKSQLNTHLLVHSSVKPFRCERCEYSCKRRWELKQHMLSHSDRKFFSCDQCDHQTKTYSDLVKHQHKHKEVRDFFCPICNNAYKDNRALRKHVRYSHGDEPPVECNICHKLFRNRINLRNHMRLHDGHYPFKCDVCNMKFSTNHNKKAHMAVHSGNRPFSCPVCPYAGKTELDMRAHIGVMHRHDKIYRCDMCDIGFSRERGLLQHYATEKHASKLSRVRALALPPEDKEIDAKPGVVIKVEPEDAEDMKCTCADVNVSAADLQLLEKGQAVLRPIYPEEKMQNQDEQERSQESGLGLAVLEGSVRSLPAGELDNKEDAQAAEHVSNSLPEGTIGTILLQTPEHNLNDVLVKTEDGMMYDCMNNNKEGSRKDAMVEVVPVTIKAEPAWN